MLTIIRTDSQDREFQGLVHLLDKDLSIRDGDEHTFYAQYNKIDLINHVVVACWNGSSVGCGAFKRFGEDSVEIKRMFVRPEKRGQGIAAAILRELEDWARELNFKCAVLETGKKQPEAIRLYEKSGYVVIPNYGQYEGMENSICMKKLLD